MSEFINTVDIVGDEILTNSLINKSVTEYCDNTVTSVRDYAFHGCTALTSVDLPNVTEVSKNAFSSCTSLTSVNLPNATVFEEYIFYGCTALISINLPKSTQIESYIFNGCTALQSVDFSVLFRINSNSFKNCSALKSVIIRYTSICLLSNANAFDGTPIKSGTGYVYVPRALLSDEDSTKDYRRATNWTTFSTQFRAIEDWTVDGTVTGAMDIENRHMVRFFDEDGTLLYYTVVTTDSPAVYPYEEPVKEGEWKFIGWSEDLTNVTEDIDCYARFVSTAVVSRKLVERTLSGDYVNDRIDAVGNCGFYKLINLTSADLPSVTSTGTEVFYGCTNLASVNLPLLASVNMHIFRGCTNLTRVDLPLATSIYTKAFYECRKLNVLILRSDTICALKNKDALTSTLIASGTGYIYVPRALLSDEDATKDYRRATNWATFVNQFRAIEDYPEICGGVA